MQRVFVLDNLKQALMPCHPARARALLKKGEAAIYRRFPFTIILKNRQGGVTQCQEFKLDPGSKITGLALVLKGKQLNKVVWAAHLTHRSQTITQNLLSRRAIRRSRRHRKLRYRPARFNNRCRTAKLLAPSLYSRVNHIMVWTRRLLQKTPISSIAVETVKFDTQQMQAPEISGVEYQQGNLFGYEIREYLLEKWSRTCAYCDATNVPLEIEHIIPKSKGGTIRLSNLTLSCRPCNIQKGSSPIQEFLAKDTQRLQRTLKQCSTPLKDAAAVNSTRYAVGENLKQLNIPISFSSGGRTKFNRTQQGYKKNHYIDAACVGESGNNIFIPKSLTPLDIIASGRGTRQMCRMDRFGFQRTSTKSEKQVKGFKTGDFVKVVITNGKKKGYYTGRIAIRSSGNFNLKTKKETLQGINYRYCKLLHHSDGYHYFAKW